MKMIQRKTPPHIPKSGRSTPKDGFFDSKNFTELDFIQHRVQRLKDEATKRDDEIAAELERLRLEMEKRRQDEEASVEGPITDERTPCAFCVKAAAPQPDREDDGGSFKALRRPIAPRCTCMDPTDGGLPVLPIEYPADIDDWAYKPFSTIVSGGAAGYRGHFPLLMQKSTESEEKDNTQVQTETRRHSVVTTNYLTGRIKLQGAGGENIHMSVFPVLHVVVSSEDEEESSSQDETDEDVPTIPDDLFAKLAQSAPTHTARRPSISQPPAQQQRRRSSLTPRGGPLLQRGGARSRVIRRRSIDQSEIAASFARALEAASDAMAPISEDQERQSEWSGRPGSGFDVTHAEQTMVHMEQNLHTLEEFLKGSSSTTDASSSDSDI